MTGLNDVCIHLQVNSLRELVEDWDFQEGPFMEFVAPTLQLLAGLLRSSEELETQLQVRSCTCAPCALCMAPNLWLLIIASKSAHTC